MKLILQQALLENVRAFRNKNDGEVKYLLHNGNNESDWEDVMIIPNLSNEVIDEVLAQPAVAQKPVSCDGQLDPEVMQVIQNNWTELIAPAVAQEPVVWECKAGGLKPLTQKQYDKQSDKIKAHYTLIPAVAVNEQLLDRLRQAAIFIEASFNKPPTGLLNTMQAAIAAAEAANKKPVDPQGRYTQGRLLITDITSKWSKEEKAAAEYKEKCLVVKQFKNQDEGKSREIICECRDPETASFVAAALNRRNLYKAADDTPAAWFFEFNNKQTDFTKDKRKAEDIKRHLAVDETCTEYFIHPTANVEVNAQTLKALRLAKTSIESLKTLYKSRDYKRKDSGYFIKSIDFLADYPLYRVSNAIAAAEAAKGGE